MKNSREAELGKTGRRGEGGAGRGRNREWTRRNANDGRVSREAAKPRRRGEVDFTSKISSFPSFTWERTHLRSCASRAFGSTLNHRNAGEGKLFWSASARRGVAKPSFEDGVITECNFVTRSESASSPKAAQKRTHYKTLARMMGFHLAPQRLVVLWSSTALGGRVGSPLCERATSAPRQSGAATGEWPSWPLRAAGGTPTFLSRTSRLRVRQ